MSVDIHMKLVHKNGTMIHNNLFDGRNSEWFDNLQGHGWDESGVYDALNLLLQCGLPEQATDEDRRNINELGYYNPYHINLKDYLEWFVKYKPEVDAGWFSTYDCWRIDNKHWYPHDEGIKHYLDNDDNIHDWHFREVIDPYNCDAAVIRELPEETQNHPEDYILYFYFDC